jgi:hypothetical protein
MKQNKNTQEEIKSVLKSKAFKQADKNLKTTNTESFETITKDGVLKPTNELYKNIHSKPADEQQFENNE